MRRRYGVQTDNDARESVVAFETTRGKLYPIFKDGRGRGFWTGCGA